MSRLRSRLRASTLATGVLALGPALASGTVQEPVRELTPAQMEEDLYVLYESLLSLHPGIHRHSTAADVDGSFGAALLAVGEGPRDLVWFYRQVSALVSVVRCGHTRVELSPRDRDAILARKGVLPLELKLSGKRAWVRRVLDPEVPIQPGTEILAIEGLPIGEIRGLAMIRMSGDGIIEAGKERELEADFASLYALLVDEHDRHESGYELQIPGSSEPLRVRALAPDELGAEDGSPERSLVELELHPEEGLGILSVRAFGDAASGPRFPELLEQSFRRLRDEGIAHLILDLRGNGGGRDQYGALLVSYLCDRPFGYFERIEVTPDYQGSVEVEIVERDGRRLMMSHSGLAQQQPADMHFEGDVHVLIDGGTFSTAADVATVLHHNRLASFAGDETGGGYDGNTSGDTSRVVLVNSGFSVSVPMWMYTTANLGHAFTSRGVIPELEIDPSIDDVLAGRDLLLQLVRERIQASGKDR